MYKFVDRVRSIEFTEFVLNLSLISESEDILTFCKITQLNSTNFRHS